MEIDINVALGYDERRDQFYLADFEVIQSDDQFDKPSKSKPKAKKSSRASGKAI